MEGSDNNVDFNILLPVCVESQCDIFFSVIRNSIERSKLDDLLNSLKGAMNGDPFWIEAEDISCNWNKLVSNVQQIRQAKILGLWAIENFPALGKKFFGPSWKPPKRNNIDVVGQAQIGPDQLDAIVFEKLKLRVCQLDASPSTLKKLRFLEIHIPPNIGKHNEYEHSQRVKTFEIIGDWIDKGWKALRSALSQAPLTSHREEITPQLVMKRKRVCLDNSLDVNERNDRNVDTSLFSGRKITCRDNSRDENCDDHSELRIASEAVEQAHHNNLVGEGVVDTVSSGTTDAIQVVLQDMRKDICQLTDLVRSTNAKDDEIVCLKSNVHEHLLANEKLKTERDILNAQVEKQSDLITALQKGVDAATKLQMKSESDLCASFEIIETMKLEISELKAQNHDLTVSKEAELTTATKINENLQENMFTLQNNSIALATELRTHIESLEGHLVTAERINSETTSEKIKLQEELEALKDCAAVKETELTGLRLRVSARQISNTEAHTDIYTKRDVKVQVDSCIEYRKDVETQTEARAREIYLPSADGKEMETKTVIAEIASQIENCSEKDEYKDGDIQPHDGRTEPEFESNDPIVKACRINLLNLKFGWMKFATTKKAKFCPGFIYPPDEDGKCRAQKVNPKGYPSSTKYECFEFNDNVPEDVKKQPEKLALHKLNEKFKFHLE